MKIDKSYTLGQFLAWTRRKVYVLLPLAIVPVILYQVLGQKWIAAPWAVAVVLGTATSFIVGFRNLQTYNRTLEALQVWTAIASTSRYWGMISRDFLISQEASKALIYRHLAWLTTLRYQLRGSNMVWESVTSRSNAEYKRKYYSVPEVETPLDAELQKYLPEAELTHLASTENKAGRLISMQSEAIKDLLSRQALAASHHIEMQKTLKDFLDQQGKVERIKNYPYPRQYATINTLFVWCFIGLLPFCLIREFDRLNEGVSGIFQGNMVWLAIPFSILISWIYVSLDQVGESTENPFEGGANDVPMAQMCRAVEIELREMLRETELPPALQPRNQIIL
jgi:ion channel-forming bestrophin family protein